MKEPAGGPPARFQFSIRHFLIATAAFAAAVSVIAAPTSLANVAALELLAILFFSTSVIRSLASSGRLRDFWIGVSICVGLGAIISTINLPLLIMFAADVPSKTAADIDVAELTQVWILPALWCFAPINGLLCVLVHRLIWPKPPESRP